MKVWCWTWLLVVGCTTHLPPALGAPADAADNSKAALSALASQARQAATEASACQVVMATEEGVSLARLSNGAARVMKVPGAAQTRPEALHDLVLYAHDGQLRAIDATSGRLRFQQPLAQPQLVGASQVGDALLVVARGRSEFEGCTLRSLSARDGSLRYARRLPHDCGAPTAVGSLLVLPVHHQALLILDVERGTELGRVRAEDGLITFARHSAGTLLFGHESVLALSDAYDGSAGSLPSLPLPSLPLPGTSVPVESAYDTPPGGKSAFGRVGLQFSMGRDASGCPVSTGVYAIFYRHVWAFDSAGALRWTQVLPGDVVRAESDEDGLWLLLDDGALTRLEAGNGTRREVAQLASSVASADLDLRGCSTGGGQTAMTGSLTEGLLQLAEDPDARLLPSRLYALQVLRDRMSGPVTARLLRLYDEPRTPPDMRSAIAGLLSSAGADRRQLVQAAAQGYDYLSGADAPPMDVLAGALAQHGGPDAVAVLEQRLFDPATSAEDLLPIAQALWSLDPEGAARALHTFLFRYRADSTFAAAPDIYVALCQLLAQAGDKAQAELRSLVEAPSTHPVLALALSAHVAPDRAAAPAAPESAQAVPEPSSPPRSYLLSADTVRATFANHGEDLPHCLSKLGEARETVTQVRVALVVDAAGVPLDRHYLPSTQAFTACFDPLVQDYRFPPSGAPRQVVVYTWDARAREDAATETADEPESQPFYADYIPSTLHGTPRGTPWWQDQNPLYISVEPSFARRPGGQAAPPPRPSKTPAVPKRDRPEREGPQEPADPPAAPQAPPTSPSAEEPAPWWLPTEP